MRRTYKNNKSEDTGSISELMLLYLENQKTGYVHSIFKSSLNIKFGKNLIHISTIDRKLTSFGCCVHKEKIQSLISVCNINDIVIKKDQKLFFYTMYGILSIDMSMLEIVNLKISHINHSRKIMEKIFVYLKSINFQTKIGIEKDKAVKYLHEGITDKSARYLVGRGKGLTPSGDDILLGYALIGYLYKKDIKLIYGNYTTDISRQYFDAFNRGYINEYIFNLFSDNDKSIENAILYIAKTGHTSGYDLLFGIFMGIKKYMEMEEM